jgi:hypothetical protein
VLIPVVGAAPRQLHQCPTEPTMSAIVMMGLTFRVVNGSSTWIEQHEQQQPGDDDDIAATRNPGEPARMVSSKVTGAGLLSSWSVCPWLSSLAVSERR